jgi:error-prone DNA polymerase
MVEGKLQREGKVVHVIVQRCFDMSKLLRGLEEVFPAARNFK